METGIQDLSSAIRPPRRYEANTEEYVADTYRGTTKHEQEQSKQVNRFLNTSAAPFDTQSALDMFKISRVKSYFRHKYVFPRKI